MRTVEARQTAGSLLCWSIGLAPVLLLLLTWPEDLSAGLRFARSYAAPILAVEIAVIVISLIEGYRLARPSHATSACLAALLIVAWRGALGAENAGASILFTAIWYLHLAYGFAFANLLVRNRVDRHEPVQAIVAGHAIFLLLFVAFIVLHYDPGRDWVHTVPAFNNIRWFGYYCAAVAGLCAWGLTRGTRSYFIAGTVALAAALWTGSRGALVAVMGGYLVAYALFPFMRKGVVRFAAMIFAAIVLSVIASTILPLGDQGPIRLLTGNGDNGRFDLWLKAITAIEQRPWLGWGEAQFNHLISPLTYAQPHNVILQILLAWGVCGGFLVAILSGRLALRILRSTTEDDAPYLLAMLTIAVFSLIDGSLYHVQSVSTFALCIAALGSAGAGSSAATRPRT
jgi:O-antigen ligase